jgi:hypothetical protein
MAPSWFSTVLPCLLSCNPTWCCYDDPLTTSLPSGPAVKIIAIRGFVDFSPTQRLNQLKLHSVSTQVQLSIMSSSYTVAPSISASSSSPVPSRRIVISVDAIKSTRVAAGDWVTVTAADKTVVAQIWPSLNLAVDGELVWVTLGGSPC